VLRNRKLVLHSRKQGLHKLGLRSHKLVPHIRRQGLRTLGLRNHKLVRHDHKPGLRSHKQVRCRSSLMRIRIP